MSKERKQGKNFSFLYQLKDSGIEKYFIYCICIYMYRRTVSTVLWKH